MVLNIFVLVIFVGILYCMGSALYYLVGKKHDFRRTAIALTWRSVLSVMLFGLLLMGAAMGWITPHGFI